MKKEKMEEIKGVQILEMLLEYQHQLGKKVVYAECLSTAGAYHANRRTTMLYDAVGSAITSISLWVAGEN